MRAKRSKGLEWTTARKLGLALLSVGVLAVAPEASAQTQPAVGVACTTSGAPADTARTFTLTTRTGYVSIPDGTSAFMWGYSDGGGSFQHPGPVLCVNQGDTVTVILNNTFASDDVSIRTAAERFLRRGPDPVRRDLTGQRVRELVRDFRYRNTGLRLDTGRLTLEECFQRIEAYLGYTVPAKPV